MNVGCILFLGMMSGSNLDLFKPDLQFTLPEAVGIFEAPRGIIQDTQGRYWVPDTLARCLYLWDKEGTFLKKLGSKGEGPGEFRFEWPEKVFPLLMGGEVAILDSMAKTLHFYQGTEYQSRETFSFPGRVIGASTLHNGQTLLVHERARKNELKMVLYEKRLGSPWSPVREVGTFELKKWVQKEAGWEFHAFLPTPWFAGNQRAQHFLVGHNATPQFKVYNLDGASRRTVQFKGVDLAVTAEDVAWLKKSYAATSTKVKTPKKHPSYRWAFPLGPNRYLVLYTYTNATFHGAILDSQGTVLHKVTRDFGDHGYIDAFGNRIFYYDSNEETLAITSPIR